MHALEIKDKTNQGQSLMELVKYKVIYIYTYINKLSQDIYTKQSKYILLYIYARSRPC